MTVGYHAPPPGSHSGVADYAETLRTALQLLGPVESGASKADIHLYHLGNNTLHEEIYARALAKPGVVVLHDAVLHHFLLGSLSREQYIAEWVHNQGEWRRDLGEELWRGRARASVDARYFQFPMLRRIVDRSLSVIVHNPGENPGSHAGRARNKSESFRSFARPANRPTGPRSRYSANGSESARASGYSGCSATCANRSG